MIAHPNSRSALRIVTAVAVALVTVSVALPRADADQISDKRAQAQAIAAKIDELNHVIEHDAEEANGAQVELDALNTQLADAQAQVDQAEASQVLRQEELRTYAITAYVFGDPTSASESEVVLPGRVDPKHGYLRAASDNRRQLIDALQASEAAVKLQIGRLDQARAAAEAKSAELKDKQREAQTAVAALVALKQQTDGELAALVEKAEAERAAAERAAAEEARRRAAEAPPATPPTTRPLPPEDTPTTIPVKPVPPGPPPPPDVDGAAAAIAYARAQLGKPYEWGADGPETFDCSGLTMMAWKAGGVSLVHYTVAQYNQTRPIALADVKPGDLIFYDDFDHVALYIGNGKIIHAPHTGAVVTIENMYFWNTTMAASRPL
jgi:cell wall-associated NlpC family hydrolase